MSTALRHDTHTRRGCDRMLGLGEVTVSDPRITSTPACGARFPNLSLHSSLVYLYPCIPGTYSLVI
jgi:hypothetical protein